MANLAWTQMRWAFDRPVEYAPLFIERLRGTPARAAALVSDLDAGRLTRRTGDAWSIQENIAHLDELDRTLFTPRLEQFLAGESALAPADMENKATWAAGFNERSMDEILARFVSGRRSIVERLDGLELSEFGREAMHPRLGRPMRLLDMCEFQADHDDYHLARVSKMIVGLIRELA